MLAFGAPATKICAGTRLKCHADLIIAEDHPGMETVRETVRDAHRCTSGICGRQAVGIGGPLADDGVTIIGGASLPATDDRAETHRSEAGAPYAKAGIRAQVTIMRWWRGIFDAKGFSE